MRKRITKKKVTRAPKKDQSHKIYGLTIVVFGGLLLFIFINTSITIFAKTHVLGATTFLAEGGDGSGGSNDAPHIDSRPGGGGDHPASFIEANKPSEMPDKPKKQEGQKPPENMQDMKPEGLQEKSSHDKSSSDAATMDQNSDVNHVDIKDEQGKFFLKQASIEAETKFPLSVDPTTHELIVTTPHGIKAVAILPAQAVANLIREGKISQVEQASGAAQVTLAEHNNEPAFVISGISNKKLFGLFPVSIHKTDFVSTQTGQVVNESESFDQKLLDLVSF